LCQTAGGGGARRRCFFKGKCVIWKIR
jgi:hypothetical protein